MDDLWDSTVHVIAWKDQSVHIYRVEDPTTRKSKVVHRNFILPVNFLPVVEPEGLSTIPSTASEEVADEEETLGNEPLFGTERNQGDSRTAVWVLSGQCPELSSMGEMPATLAEHPVEVITRLGTREHQTTSGQEDSMASSDEGCSSENSSQSIVSERDVSGNDSRVVVEPLAALLEVLSTFVEV